MQADVSEVKLEYNLDEGDDTAIAGHNYPGIIWAISALFVHVELARRLNRSSCGN